MKVLVITGPTGVGKTELAAVLAQRHNLEIISADSRQVYRHMDIGTAKPDPKLRRQVQFHMIDVVEPGTEYSAADYARDALRVMHQLENAGRRFIVVGGAGFYLRALFQPLFETVRPDPKLRGRLRSETTTALYERLRQLDPDRARQLHPNDRQRIIRALEIVLTTGKTFAELAQSGRPGSRFEPEYVVLTMPRELLRQAIDRRFDMMMEAGLLEEVRRLKEMGLGTAPPVAQAYGYAELLAWLDGRLTLTEAVALAKQKSRAYAKRQLTWFRALPDAVWVECHKPGQALAQVEPILRRVLAETTAATI